RAREATLGGRCPVAAAPAVRADDDRLGVGLVDVQAAGLAEPPRARLPEARRGHEDGRSRPVPDGLEIVTLAHRRLVDVAAEDAGGAGRGGRLENLLSPGEGALGRRAPWSADEVVVEDGDPQCPRLRLAEPCDRALEPTAAEPTALVVKGPRRVDADDM